MSIIQTLNQFLSLFIKHAPEAFIFVSIMWLIHLLNNSMRGVLNLFGIIPRNPVTLILGPITSPFLHADFSHLSYNSLPLFVMTATLFTHSVAKGLAIIFTISYIEGIFVWCFARRGNHIGASGLIMGLFGYFLYLGYANPNAETVIVAIILFYYFGTLLLSIFPEDTLTSFEGHLAGLIAGLLIAHFGYPDFVLNISTPIASFIQLISLQLFG